MALTQPCVIRPRYRVFGIDTTERLLLAHLPPRRADPRQARYLLACQRDSGILSDRRGPLSRSCRSRGFENGRRPRRSDACGGADPRRSTWAGEYPLARPDWLADFRINERKVNDYGCGRVFLAGDAAHVHSPAGGQGMNTGMQDAFNLAWKLAMVVHGTAPPPRLASYSVERSAVGDHVLRNATRLTDVPRISTPWSRRLALSSQDRSRPVAGSAPHFQYHDRARHRLSTEPTDRHRFTRTTWPRSAEGWRTMADRERTALRRSVGAARRVSH